MTLWAWTINNIEKKFKLLGPYGPGPFIILFDLENFSDYEWPKTIFEKLIAPGSILQTCSWSSVHFKYGPGAYLT